MKTVLIVSELSAGGVEKVNMLLAENFDRAKYNVVVLSITGMGYDNYEKPKNFTFVNLNAKNQSSALKRIMQAYKDIKADIIVTTGGYATYLGILYRKLYANTCKVIYVHHSVYSINLENKSFSQLLIHHHLSRLINIYGLCDYVIYVSNGVKEDFEKYYKVNPSRQKVIYNPVIEDNITIDTTEKTQNRIISIGRLEAEKDHSTLIKAVNELHKKGIKVMVDILGNGSLESELKAQVKTYELQEYIKFRGFSTNVYEYLNKANLFVLTSIHESFGNVIIEAMHAGVPVISTDCIFGPREIIGDNEYGYLVPVGDYVTLANMIEKVLNTDNSNLLDKSFEYSKRFTVKNAVSKYEELIDSL